MNWAFRGSLKYMPCSLIYFNIKLNINFLYHQLYTCGMIDMSVLSEKRSWENYFQIKDMYL